MFFASDFITIINDLIILILRYIRERIHHYMNRLQQSNHFFSRLLYSYRVVSKEHSKNFVILILFPFQETTGINQVQLN
jgi:hypothetical protein